MAMAISDSLAMDRSNVVNFGAGPSALPLTVLQKATAGLLNYKNTGIGLTELSHRSKEFTALERDLESLIRTQLNVPSSHHILFVQNGGTGQFSAAIYNLLARHTLLHPNLKQEDRKMDYILTGSWSKKASDEARRLGGGAVNIVADGRKFSADGKSFDNIPPHAEWKISDKPAFIYYCENETVDGVQFSHLESSPSSFPFHLLKDDVPIVADYSSSFMSRPIPRLADHALIYAGAQKNIGPSGLTIVIVREDVLVDVDAAAKLGAAPVPLLMSYKLLADNLSLYNTPPMFPMYVAQLVLQEIKDKGGLTALEQKNNKKQELLYNDLEEYASQGLIKIRVQKPARSWMNATFVLTKEGQEKEFLADAEKQGLMQLKGHRSVGGIRVSLYNAISVEEVQRLLVYMKAFFNNC